MGFLFVGGPKLTHLLFANDSLLFCRSTMEECGKVLEILNKYEMTSGQKLIGARHHYFLVKTLTMM